MVEEEQKKEGFRNRAAASRKNLVNIAAGALVLL
jgi:hypothetical protein